MLIEAAAWRPGAVKPTVETVLADPALSHYVAGWPLPGDRGVVAGVDGQPVGAAWYRLLGEDDAGYGWVDNATPEVSIGVSDAWRGRGVGTLLLDALHGVAASDGVAQLCLSVEEDNPALRLYERYGYVTVSRNGGAWTMIRPIA
jgi:ribosomal protein S18 acetylase RimI-like enzyme